MIRKLLLFYRPFLPRRATNAKSIALYGPIIAFFRREHVLLNAKEKEANTLSFKLFVGF